MWKYIKNNTVDSAYNINGSLDLRYIPKIETFLYYTVRLLL